ncbi:MAG TPA: hypothetical protein VIV40_16185, partial [Kofleriaceae bacterium]
IRLAAVAMRDSELMANHPERRANSRAVSPSDVSDAEILAVLTTLEYKVDVKRRQEVVLLRQ